MSLNLNGREIRPGDVGRVIAADMKKRVSASTNARLDGLWCAEHQRSPVAECADDVGSVRISACCKPMLELAQARIGMATTISDAAPSVTTTNDATLAESPDALTDAIGRPLGEHQRKPKVFLSHASADKERIVRPLDALLRARGIDVWLDERDLLPGHNLVEEIFTHGISKSDVVVVVLSANSIDRPWVSEELSVAVVQKINGVVKLIIPVVIDGVAPPVALAATVWERVPDLGNLEVHADRIAASVIGTTPPPIAPKPAYAGIPVHRLAGLSPDDERIFVFACEQLLANETAYPLISFRHIADRAMQSGMSEDLVYESVAALEHSFFFHELGGHHRRNRPKHGRVRGSAFERYLTAYRPTQYRKEKLAIISAVVNEGANHSRGISQALGIHEYLVKHVFEALESGGYVLASHAQDGIHIMPEPTLPRLLREMERDE